MKKIIWLIKQLIPCMYFSKYSTDGHREVAVWRQWFGVVLWHQTYEVV